MNMNPRMTISWYILGMVKSFADFIDITRIVV